MKISKYSESNDKVQYRPSNNKRNDSSNQIYIVSHENIIHTNFTKPCLSSVIFYLSNFSSFKDQKYIKKYAIMPEINKIERKRTANPRSRSSYAILQKINMQNSSNYLAEHNFKYKLNSFNNTNQTNFKVYRCQLTPGVAENCDICCCSCNSDTLFEVMKDLYDCYKSRNCDNCNCILCCQFLQNAEEAKRSIREAKSVTIGLETALKEVAMKGFALPEGKSESEKELIDKIRYNLGLPPEPKTQSMRDKYTNAANAGILLPLEKKSVPEKEKLLRGLANVGIPLPEGRTPSEKNLIAKVQNATGTPLKVPSPLVKMRKAKNAGLLTPFEGKNSNKIEKIIRELATRGIPLPQAKTKSKRNLIKKVRADLGLPPEPKTSRIRDKHKKAAKVGLLMPLEGKTSAQKEKILRGLHNMGVPLPIGRTPSEKALIAKITAESKTPSKLVTFTSSEKMRRMESARLPNREPLENKTSAQKEKMLREIAMKGIPLPTGKTDSDRKLINKIRLDLGVPPEPKTASMKNKHAKAADVKLLLPLEGKSLSEKQRILKGLADMRIPLPKGRSPSEKSLIAKVKLESHEPLISPDRMREAKALGLFTPLYDKNLRQKEKILKGLAMHGFPLPQGNTKSDKYLINKIRADLGVPPEPKTAAMKDKYSKAADAGLLLPLEGKSRKEKERILQGFAHMGIPLPEGRTSSEKALIAKMKLEARESLTSSANIRKITAAGLHTPLEGKTLADKEKIFRGLAVHGTLPEGKSKSEREMLNKIRAEYGLPPEPITPSMKEIYAKAAGAGLLLPLEGKSLKEKERILQGFTRMKIPLPEGRTSSEKALIAKIKLEAGRSVECICDASAKSTIEKAKIAKLPSITMEKLRKAKAAGLLTPLGGKSTNEKEKILKNLAKAGLPLPVGRNPSDVKLISQIKKDFGILEETSEEKFRKAKANGFLAPLENKTPDEKAIILWGRAAAGLPLPEGNTPSDKHLINKIKAATGYVTPSASERLRKSEAAVLLAPLKGKTSAEKEKILRDMLAAGMTIPEGTTLSEKEIIKNLLAPPLTKSKKLKAAKAAGLLTPLTGKVSEQKEKILKGLTKVGLPLPKPNTPSESDLIDKIRAEIGLPPEPASRSLRERYEEAYDAGIITPLEGKSPEAKERILKKLQIAGIPLPVGRTPSEKSIIKRIKTGLVTRPKTHFDEMSPEKKKRILKHLIKSGRPVPDFKTLSEKELVKTVRREMGLPPEPKTESMKLKMLKAQGAGLITPLEGKSQIQKYKILTRLAKAGIPLPKARTPSEKSMIRKIEVKYKKRRVGAAPSIPSAMLEKARDFGLLTPLTGKTLEEKGRILRGLAKQGLPLPDATTPSDKSLDYKIRKELGLPPQPITLAMKEKHNLAAADGILLPLEGSNRADKTKRLRALAFMGIPLPEGRTPSEQKLIDQILEECRCEMKIRDVEAAGIITPLEGKSLAEKERIIRGLAAAALPLPKGKTRSERSLIRKIKAEFGIPPTGRTPSQRDVIRKAKAQGLFTPLADKKPAEKERIMRGLAEAGLPLPEGKTATEKDIINRIKAGLEATGTEDYKILKSTCERACGCEKKKIKFKHSYVKIEILSPDISTICPCPNKCIPHVKGGINADDKGINIIIERAIGVSEYSKWNTKTATACNKIQSNKQKCSTSTMKKGNREIKESRQNGHMYEHRSFKLGLSRGNNNFIIDSPFTYNCISDESSTTSTQYDFNYNLYQNKPTEAVDNDGSLSSKINDAFNKYIITPHSSQDSFDSIFFVKSENSLDFSSNSCEDTNTDRIIILSDCTATSNITPNLPYSSLNVGLCNTLMRKEFGTNEVDFRSVDTIARSSYNSNSKSAKKSRTKENNFIDTKKIRNDDCQIYQMSQKKLANEFETHSKTNEKSKTGQPVIVINQLNREIDVATVIDEILSKEEFSNASSLFVIVPTSDDEDGQANCSGFIDSSTCIQLSKNYNKWNFADEGELYVPHHQTASNISGLRVSAKGKRFILEGAPTAAVSPNNKETMYSNAPPRHHRATKNEICQKNSLGTIAQRRHIVSTDTTQDRPCCCVVGQSESIDSIEAYKDRCIMNVVSERTTALLNNQVDDSVTLSIPRKRSRHRARFMPMPTTSLSLCQIPPCTLQTSCHPSNETIQCPPSNKLCQPLLELKKLLEQQYSPDTIRELFNQIQAGKEINMKHAGNNQARMTPGYCDQTLPCPLPAGSITSARTPTTPLPTISALKHKDENCPTCFKPKYKDGIKLKCACSGKKKTVRMRALCPCEQHQLPMSQALLGPKEGAHSVGCQCCICDETPIIGTCGEIIPRLGQTAPMCLGPPVSIGIQDGPGILITPKGVYKLRKKDQPMVIRPLPMGFYGQPDLHRKIGQLEIIGPLGGYAYIGLGGTYTQAGMRQTRYTTGVGTHFDSVGAKSAAAKKNNCACSDKKGKKKGKVICECPPQPKPEQEPDSGPEIGFLASDMEALHYLDYYNDFREKQYKRYRVKQQQMRSDLTQTTSGFKFNKKKQPADESDISVEDAIRYYAITNPDLLRKYMPPDPHKRIKEDCVCDEIKPANTEVDCECPDEPLTEAQKAAAARSRAARSPWDIDLSKLPGEDDGLPKGFTIRMPGRGSGSKGLSGICCFDMVEERKDSQKLQH